MSNVRRNSNLDKNDQAKKGLATKLKQDLSGGECVRETPEQKPFDVFDSKSFTEYKTLLNKVSTKIDKWHE
jgi:hypothetical protein